MMVPYIPPADVAGGFGRSFSSARQDALADLIARDQVRLRQAQEARAQQQQEWAAAEEAELAKLRPLKLAAEKLALRGQILGPVATPQEYDVARGEVERLGLPTADLPEAEHSTAWQTFQKPAEPAKVGGWLPQQWFPDALPQAPEETAPMPTGPMRGAGIAHDDIPAVQRAAERGLPILQQSQIQDKSIGRQIQKDELQARADKYRTQLDYADKNADLAERRFVLQETRDERAARLERERIALARAADKRAADQAERDAKIGPKFTADQTSAATYGRRVQAGIADLDRVATTGYDPTNFQSDLMLKALITAKPGTNLFASPAARQTAQAYRNIVNAILRRESGAVISDSEFANAQQQYFPAHNDDPATLAQKRRNLEQALAGLRTGAGAAWDATPSVTVPKDGANGPNLASGSYRFTRSVGGVTYGRNSDSENWKRVK